MDSSSSPGPADEPANSDASPKKLPAKSIGLVVAVVILAALFIGYRWVQRSSTDQAVVSHARQLSAATGNFFLQNGVSTAAYSDLVGPGKHIINLYPIAGETYPIAYTQGAAITVTGIAGMRTITYAP